MSFDDITPFTTPVDGLSSLVFLFLFLLPHVRPRTTVNIRTTFTLCLYRFLALFLKRSVAA